MKSIINQNIIQLQNNPELTQLIKRKKKNIIMIILNIYIPYPLLQEIGL